MYRRYDICEAAVETLRDELFFMNVSMLEEKVAGGLREALVEKVFETREGLDRNKIREMIIAIEECTT